MKIDECLVKVKRHDLKKVIIEKMNNVNNFLKSQIFITNSYIF